MQAKQKFEEVTVCRRTPPSPAVHQRTPAVPPRGPPPPRPRRSRPAPSGPTRTCASPGTAGTGPPRGSSRGRRAAARLALIMAGRRGAAKDGACGAAALLEASTHVGCGGGAIAAGPPARAALEIACSHRSLSGRCFGADARLKLYAADGSV